ALAMSFYYQLALPVLVCSKITRTVVANSIKPFDHFSQLLYDRLGRLNNFSLTCDYLVYHLFDPMIVRTAQDNDICPTIQGKPYILFDICTIDSIIFNHLGPSTAVRL